MDRKYHKKNILYNIDKVNEKIGLDRDHTMYDDVDVFIDRIHKKSGTIIFSISFCVFGSDSKRTFWTT